MKTRCAVCLGLCIIILFAMGCSGPALSTPTVSTEAKVPATAVQSTAEPTRAPATAVPTQAATTVAQATVAPTAASAQPTVEPGGAPVTIDGIVEDGEYAHDATFEQVRVWWRNDGQSLYLAMEGKTTGWIAVGLVPDNRMQGANFLIGSVVDGKAGMSDAFGTAPVAAHPPDEELGGKNDIIAFAGVEQDGVTRFEVQIPLDSGDQYDKPLQPGTAYPIIVALGSGDGPQDRHTFRGRGEIRLD